MKLTTVLLEPQALTEALTTVGMRQEVAAFIDDLRDRLESNEGYLAALTEAGTQDVNAENLLRLSQALDPYVQLARPGHDVGHVYRDMMTALAIVANDPSLAMCHAADVLAGLLGGTYHDIAVAVSPKYLDRAYECGHAEVGAFMFYRASEGILCEPLRALTAYAIAAHTQYTSDMVVESPVLHPQGWERRVYNDELFSLGDGSEGNARVAVWLTRFADRLDNNGISHFARHVLAMADDVATEGAQDFSGGQFFGINPETLVVAMTPEVKGGGDEGAPSTLKHMENYRDSNYKIGSPYAKNDHLFPFFVDLIAMKAAQVTRFVDVATTESSMDPTEAWDQFEALLRHVSQSQFVDDPIAVLKSVWDDKLTDAERSRWGTAAMYGVEAYDASLGKILSSILAVAQSDIVIAALPTIIPPMGVLRS